MNSTDPIRLVRSKPSTSNAVDRLSKREREVITLISQGCTNQEIAETLYLSVNSVKTYIRTAYRRIDVTRRSQAVIWGIANERRLAELSGTLLRSVPDMPAR